ncbi:MAG: AraC family transcriptional regulator [Chromatiales bacterium]|nr:AraC family transcriptional regulator [Chromatiales bacterium]
MSETVEFVDALSDWLRRIDFRAEVFFRAEYCGNWAVNTSGSNNVPFHLVAQGEGWLHGEAKPPQRLLPGNLVFFPHDQAHVLSATEEIPLPEVVNRTPAMPDEGPATRLVCGYFLLDRQLAAPLLAGLPSTIVLNLADAPSSSARELVHLLMREAAEKRPGGDVAVDRLAELVFIEALRTEGEAGRLVGVFSALGDPRLGTVLAAIHRHPEESHRLEDMAAASNLSESAFTQRFKKAVGMTPGQYVRHWRLQTAARALRETQRAMTDIATSVGYDSDVAFRKAFRAYFDQSPGAYRQLASVHSHLTASDE